MTEAEIAEAKAIRRTAEIARMTQAAKTYAAADRSDPFAFRRAMSHIGCGVASVLRGEHSKEYSLDRAQTAFYSAEPYTYDRTIHGLGKVPTVGYRNVVRP